jgi:hypothetical protein
MSRVLDMSFPFALTDVNRPQIAIVKSLAKKIVFRFDGCQRRHPTDTRPRYQAMLRGLVRVKTPPRARSAGAGVVRHTRAAGRGRSRTAGIGSTSTRKEKPARTQSGHREGASNPLLLRPRFRVESVPAQINAKRLVVSLIDEIRLAGPLVAQGREQPREALPIVSEVHNRSIT